jgi:hypothetical protein
LAAHKRFAALNPTPGEVPALSIAVPYEQDTPFIVNDQRLRAHGQHARGASMRSLKISKPPPHNQENDLADWYVIGGFAVASFAAWVLLLSKSPF